MRAFWVTVGEADEDEAVTALWEAGTVGMEVRQGPAGRVRLLAYFEGDASDSPAGLPEPGFLSGGSVVSGGARLPASATIEAASVDEVDWVARFREGFHAFPAGRFVVAPPWDLPAGVKDPAVLDRPRDLVLVVDPGRAFGTGTHETTRLCLAALEDLAARRQLGRTLDLGAGTGLLAVAAVRLGAAFVCASDVDREANHSSAHHARLNGVRLAVVRADGGRGFRQGSFDLVLANLMALLLVDRAAEIRALLAPGGALVLSGLLAEDVASVREAFASCGLSGDDVAAASGTVALTVDGEWAALVYEDVP